MPMRRCRPSAFLPWRSWCGNSTRPRSWTCNRFFGANKCAVIAVQFSFRQYAAHGYAALAAETWPHEQKHISVRINRKKIAKRLDEQKISVWIAFKMKESQIAHIARHLLRSTFGALAARLLAGMNALMMDPKEEQCCNDSGSLNIRRALLRLATRAIQVASSRKKQSADHQVR